MKLRNLSIRSRLMGGFALVLLIAAGQSLLSIQRLSVVNDQSTAHNFHLTGPGGVDVSTEVSDEGEKTFDVTLVAGEYKFQCDPHASSMNGSFEVTG